MRNVEIKARIKNLNNLIQRIEKLTSQPPTVLQQCDTFYPTVNGRLKLRLINNVKSELIYYNRPDTEGPKLSSFDKLDLAQQDGENLSKMLADAFGVSSQVKKQRNLYMVDQTRIHVDEVESLGNFVELEVCLKDSQSVEEGQKIAEQLMEELGIIDEDLVRGAYADLLKK